MTLGDRPQQFVIRDKQLEVQREISREVTKDWVPPETNDTRDLRDPEHVGLKWLYEHA